MVEVKAGATAYPVALLKNPNYDPENPNGLVKQVAAAFASGLKVNDAGVDYQIEFNANEAAPSARLIAETAAGEKGYVDLGAVKKGANSYTVAKDQLPDGQCTWSIEITSSAAENAYCTYSENNDDIGNNARGGVWMVSDPESDFFGHTFVGYGWVGEIAEYDAALNELDRMDASWTSRSNGYSPSRMSYVNDRIYMTDFSDGNSGVYYLDLNDRRSGIQSIFDTSTRNSDGAMTYGGEIMGGSTSHVAFTGSGEETVMWCFPEDYPNSNASTDADHVLRGWKIGLDKTITKAPEYAMPKNGLANCWQYIIPTDKGMWVSQKRAAGNNSSTYPGIIYMDLDGNKLYSSHVNASDMGTVNGNIALTDDHKQMVVDQGNDGLYLYDITWNDGTPTLKLNGQIPDTENELGSDNYTQLQFDPAGNLLVFKRGCGLRVYAMKSDAPRVSIVPAKSSYVLTGSGAGISDVKVDADSATPVYYNLQGVKVTNPEHGIFIEVRGNKATKVVK